MPLLAALRGCYGCLRKKRDMPAAVYWQRSCRFGLLWTIGFLICHVETVQNDGTHGHKARNDRERCRFGLHEVDAPPYGAEHAPCEYMYVHL